MANWPYFEEKRAVYATNWAENREICPKNDDLSSFMAYFGLFLPEIHDAMATKSPGNREISEKNSPIIAIYSQKEQIIGHFGPKMGDLLSTTHHQIILQFL